MLSFVTYFNQNGSILNLSKHVNYEIYVQLPNTRRMGSLDD